MNKSDLTEQLAKQFLNIPEKQIAKFVNDILEHLSQSLVDNKRIEIRDFGSFSLHCHAAREAHNPKTGEKLVTEKKSVPHFKPGKNFRDRINQSRLDGIEIVEE